MVGPVGESMHNGLTQACLYISEEWHYSQDTGYSLAFCMACVSHMMVLNRPYFRSFDLLHS